LKGGTNSTITVSPNTRLFVCGNVNYGGLDILPDTLDPTKFQIYGFGTDPHNAFRAGGGSDLIGDIFTPNGGIHLGSGGSTASFKGHLWAGGQVDIEHGVNGSTPGDVIQPPSPGAKDATLSHGAKNENNGANLSIWVKQQIAGIVGFDVKGVNFPAVTKATLRLTVCYTPADPTFCPTPPNQWPGGGGINDAQRLEDGWERWGSGFPNPTNTPPEGNGNNFPIKNNPRGDGQGVTWNCAIDTDIADQGQDCSNADGNFWNAGLNHDGPLRPSTVITNALGNGAIVEFDVTADVQAGLGPLDTTFMTWFIRKTPNTGAGEIFYYSREGAAAAGPPEWAPQLILVP
jgi:hypothetical protein